MTIVSGVSILCRRLLVNTASPSLSVPHVGMHFINSSDSMHAVLCGVNRGCVIGAVTCWLGMRHTKYSSTSASAAEYTCRSAISVECPSQYADKSRENLAILEDKDAFKPSWALQPTQFSNEWVHNIQYLLTYMHVHSPTLCPTIQHYNSQLFILYRNGIQESQANAR